MASFDEVYARLEQGAREQSTTGVNMLFARSEFQRAGQTIGAMSRACDAPYSSFHNDIESGRLSAISNVETSIGYLATGKQSSEKAVTTLLGALDGSTRSEATEVRGALVKQTDDIESTATLGGQINEALGQLTVATMVKGLELIASDIQAADNILRDRGNSSVLIMYNIDQMMPKKD